MKLVYLDPDDLVITSDLSRSGSSKQFEERLRASIEEIGIAEPLKVAPLPKKKYLVVDGVMRLRAIQELRKHDTSALTEVPAYVVDFARRYELRYQTDIYQDLLPSQLATLVEHLHKAEHIRKTEIARFIGVSAPTLRNYTGLWRLIQRRGLFARIVELMDVAVLPSSNPYAWLRLTAYGLRLALESSFSDGERVETWIDERVRCARRGDVRPFSIKFVEAGTTNLPAACYREAQEVRTLKRHLGLRRAAPLSHRRPDSTTAVRHLRKVSRNSQDAVLRSAARSLRAYIES